VLRTLVSEVGSVRLVEAEWQVLDPDDIWNLGPVLDYAGGITKRHALAVNGGRI